MQIEKVKTENHVSFVSVNGLLAAQSYEVLKLLPLLPIAPMLIEIGTCRGGFSLLLRFFFKNAWIITYDNMEWNPIELKRSQFKTHNIEYRIENVFNSSSLNDLLRLSTRKIVFCDGGNKADEFNIFSGLINSGDVIMAHDYFETEFLRDDKVWTTHETWLDQIKKSVADNNLKQILKEESFSSVWGIFEKQ